MKGEEGEKRDGGEEKWREIGESREMEGDKRDGGEEGEKRDGGREER